MKILKFMLIMFYMILAFVGIAISMALLRYSVTGWGKVVAMGGFALSLIPATIYLRYAQVRNRLLWGWVSAALGVVIIAVLAGVVLTTPSGYPPTTSLVQQRFSQQTQFPRYDISNIVPEAEQVNLGFWVMPFLDKRFTRRQAARVSVTTFDLYKKMENDPDFREMGSAMGWAYADLRHQPFDVGHYYLYVPKNRKSAALPAIVFLHGSAGNFKVYTWVWSQLAEELGYAIIVPSFGFGNWRGPGGESAVTKALADAQTVVQLDQNRIYLAGLSNGGLGVSLLAESAPERFRGLIFISPVMVTEQVDQPAFQAKWAGRPVLVLTGEADERIPLSYVTTRVENLAQGGVDVEYHTYPGEDHFLLFSQREPILQVISKWLNTLP